MSNNNQEPIPVKQIDIDLSEISKKNKKKFLTLKSSRSKKHIQTDKINKIKAADDFVSSMEGILKFKESQIAEKNAMLRGNIYQIQQLQDIVSAFCILLGEEKPKKENRRKNFSKSVSDYVGREVEDEEEEKEKKELEKLEREIESFTKTVINKIAQIVAKHPESEKRIINHYLNDKRFDFSFFSNIHSTEYKYYRLLVKIENEKNKNEIENEETTDNNNNNNNNNDNEEANEDSNNDNKDDNKKKIDENRVDEKNNIMMKLDPKKRILLKNLISMCEENYSINQNLNIERLIDTYSVDCMTTGSIRVKKNSKNSSNNSSSSKVKPEPKNNNNQVIEDDQEELYDTNYKKDNFVLSDSLIQDINIDDLIIFTEPVNNYNFEDGTKLLKLSRFGHNMWYIEHFVDNKSHQIFASSETPIGSAVLCFARIKNTDEIRVLLRIKTGDICKILNSQDICHNNKISIKSALKIMCPQIASSKFKEYSGRTVERSIIKYEMSHTSNKFKFGIIYVKKGQAYEEEYFHNRGGDKEYEDFLNLLGNKIRLKNFGRFNGGLDVTKDTTGTHSVFLQWQEYEIMFHVSTLLPHQKSDFQQLERKRHIGNDIVILAFLEDGARFRPDAISSQFIHVIVGVKPVIRDKDGNVTHYSINIASKVDVTQVAPPLPIPPILPAHRVKNYLIQKMVNYEISCYNSPQFSKKLSDTRSMLLEQTVLDFGAPKKKTKTI